MTTDQTDPSNPPPDTNDGLDANGDVGPGRPPKPSQFKPGESGNPKGRPVGAKSQKKIVEQIANEMHWVVDGGQWRHRSTIELVLLSLRNRSVEGNVRPFRAFHEYLAKYGPQEPINSGGYLIVPEIPTVEEWSAQEKTRLAKQADERE